MRLPTRAAALVAALTLAACGAESPATTGQKPEDILGAAIAASSAADSYRAKVTLAVEGDDQSIDMSGQMVSNSDSTRAFGKFSYSEDGGPAVEMKTVTAGGRQYVQAPALVGKLPHGKRWVRTPQGTARTLTPMQFMDILRRSDDIEIKGETTVDGTKAVRLGGPLDLKTLAEHTDNAELRKVVAGAGRYESSIDVWVDTAADRIVRMALRMGADGRELVFSEAEMLEYGLPLDSIKAPPAKQVATQAD